MNYKNENFLRFSYLDFPTAVSPSKIIFKSDV